MSVLSERSQGLRLLNGLEDGTLDSGDAIEIVDKIDPILTYFVLRFLRGIYKDPNAGGGVIGRLADLGENHQQIAKIMREGEQDSMREWFDDTHDMSEFRGDAEGFVDLIVDKLES